MSKASEYLQQHLSGEVIASADVLEHFSTDGSILQIMPQMVVYPQNEEDVRKTARFSWQLAEKGRVIPITARGLGTDQAGGALGSGIILVFPAHMNKLLFLDSGKGTAIVQPGLNYGKLQQALQTNGIFIPPYPTSLEYSTIGGAVANNAGGAMSVKYGTTKDYVNGLKVVLANGEMINTGNLSKRDLNHKKGLASFEGEVYRSLDGLLEDNKELLEKTRPTLSKNVSGYNLWGVKDGKGGFDLTPLFVGAQGTLGIITEIQLSAITYNPVTSLVVGFFDDFAQANTALEELKKLQPCRLEIVDEKLLKFVEKHNPNQLKTAIDKSYAKITVLVEFDDMSKHQQSSKVKKAKKIFEQHGANCKSALDEQEKDDLWKLRQGATVVSWFDDSGKKALPVIDDAVLPSAKVEQFFETARAMLDKLGIDYAMWGHGGNSHFHIQPFLDLNALGDRQKIFKLLDSYYGLVVDLGGSISGEYNDGRLRAPFVKWQYGDEIYNLFEKVKQIFDPHGILNPGVKTGIKMGEVQQLLRQDYNVSRLFDYLPHL